MIIGRLDSIQKHVRHYSRYRDIVTVVLRYIPDMAAAAGLHRYIPFVKKRHLKRGPEAGGHVYERLRMGMEELGPTFVKLGQILSTRRDAFPDEMIAELEKLQETVGPFPGHQAKAIIEEDFGAPVERLFASFAPSPLASASIAQVHEAYTKNGDRVVVKIRRPGIEKTVAEDLDIMRFLASVLERHVEATRVFAPVSIVREFSRVFRRELDFTAEAGHIERFARCFDGDGRVHIPRVHRDLSSKRVLTMEYVSGIKVSSIEQAAEQGIDPVVIAKRGAELVFEMVFIHGLYHADPHPGNLKVWPGNVICFLDFGMVGVLTTRYREELGNLILGFVHRDERQITSAVFRMSGYTQFERTERVEADVVNFIEDHLYRPLRDLHIGEMLNELTRLLLVHDIRMPSDFFILTKALATIESVGRLLDPDFDVVGHAEPLVKRLLREKVGLKKLSADLVATALDTQSLVRELPSDARQILSLLKRGEIRVKSEHHGLENLMRTHEKVATMMVQAIVLAALIVGSSIMVLSDIPPKWREIPIVGWIGFVVSGMLGFALLYSIRHRVRIGDQ